MEHVILDNGVNVFLLQDNTKHSTYFNLIVKFGGLDNKYYLDNKLYNMKDGMAHFIEHLVLESNCYGDLIDCFGQLGIISNGLTSLHHTQFYVDAVEHVYDSIKILIKGVHSPKIDNDIIKDISEPIIEEKTKSLDNKYTVAANKVISNVVDNNKFNSILGDIDTLKKMKIKDIESAFKAFYRPSNEIIVVGGNFDKDTVLNIINESYKVLSFDNNEFKKYNYEHKKEVNRINDIVKVNTGINHTMLLFKLDTINYDADVKIKLDFYLYYFLKMNFGVMSDFSKKLIEDGIISEGISFFSSAIEGYQYIRIEADTSKHGEFVNRVLDYMNNNYVFDEEIFSLSKKASIIELISRKDMLNSMIDPLIENIVRFNYYNIDQVDNVINYTYDDFVSTIMSISFNNYSILEMQNKN